MISVKTFVLAVIQVGLLCTLIACGRQALLQHLTQAQPAAEVKPSFTTDGTTATQELVPVSAPATEPEKPAPDSSKHRGTVERSRRSASSHRRAPEQTR
jgi:hypothetical protein